MLDSEGAAVDEILLTREAAPERFTLSTHGGAGVVAAVRGLLVRAGAAEVVSAPEAAGRCEAEAEALLPQARTRLACQVLLRQQGGALRAEVERLLAAPRAAEVARLLLSAQLGRRLLQPARVALWGVPNAGKSSLLNALLGRKRVLVAAAAGTTRDAVEVELDLEGTPVSLVDTAGQRESLDPLEAEGVALAREEGQKADLRLVVVDGTEPASSISAPEPRLVVWSKRDLDAWSAPPPDVEAIAVSAADGSGLDKLRGALRAALLGSAQRCSPEGPVVFTRRQAGLVAGALRALERGDSARARRCLQAVLG